MDIALVIFQTSLRIKIHFFGNFSKDIKNILQEYFTGKEYDYIIETLNRKTHCYSNLIVFDLYNDVNMPDTKDHAYFNITVLFQRKYVYALTKGDMKAVF